MANPVPTFRLVRGPEPIRGIGWRLWPALVAILGRAKLDEIAAAHPWPGESHAGDSTEESEEERPTRGRTAPSAQDPSGEVTPLRTAGVRRGARRQRKPSTPRRSEACETRMEPQVSAPSADRIATVPDEHEPSASASRSARRRPRPLP